MLVIESERPILKIKTIWFSDYPFDVKNCSHVLFCACKNDAGLEGFTKQEFTTSVIDLTQELDQTWRNIHRKARQSINKAVTSEIVVKLNTNYDEFKEIDHKFRKDKGIGSSAISTRFMKKYGTLFTAEYDGEVIGGELCLEDKDNIRMLIGSTKRLDVSKEKARLMGNATKLLFWEAMKYAKNKGIKEFDLGGYYIGKEPDPQKENINDFKNSFGGQLVTHYIYEKNYSKTYRLAKKMYRIIYNIK